MQCGLYGDGAKRSFAADSDEVTPSDDTEAASRRGFGGAAGRECLGGGRGRCMVRIRPVVAAAWEGWVIVRWWYR